MEQKDLAAIIDSTPRVRLANLPTPLEDAPRLREALGPDCPRILIKRDDLTGFAFGGNKARHVEFRLPDIQATGADTLVLANPGQSNHVRMHAALGAKFGLHTVMLKVPDAEKFPVNGNLLLDHLFGATIVDATSSDRDVVQRELDELIADLESRGHVVYDVNRRPFSGIASVIAYMAATLELLEQLESMNTTVDHIVIAGNSSASGVGLVGKYLGRSFTVHPVSVRQRLPQFANMVCHSGNQTAEALKIDTRLVVEDFHPHDEYVGDDWGIPTSGGLEAQRLAARTEGLVLEPVFTGKAMDALIDQIRKGAFSKDDVVVFVHTGGHPIFFAYSEETMESLSEVSTLL